MVSCAITSCAGLIQYVHNMLLFLSVLCILSANAITMIYAGLLLHCHWNWWCKFYVVKDIFIPSVCEVCVSERERERESVRVSERERLGGRERERERLMEW